MIINNSLSPSIPEFLIKIEEIMRSKFLFFYPEKDAHIAHTCMIWCLQIEDFEINIICLKFSAAQQIDLTNDSNFNVNIHQTDVYECIHIANVEQWLQMLCDCSWHQPFVLRGSFKMREVRLDSGLWQKIKLWNLDFRQKFYFKEEKQAYWKKA